MNTIKEIQNDRIKKYSYKNEFTRKASINIDIDTLRLLASLSVSDNATVNRKVIFNLNRLFESINLDNYKNNHEKMKYIDIITRACDVRLKKGINNRHIILSEIRGGIISYCTNEEGVDDYSDIFDTLNIKLNNEELKYLDSVVESSLTYISVSDVAPQLMEVISEIEQNKTNSKINENVEKFNNIIINYMNVLRNNKSNMGEDIPFRLSSSYIDNSIDDYISKNEKISEKILCGVQGLNEIVGYGFERERCYMFTGIAGVGKSLLCLNLLRQMMLFNKNIKTMDPNKKPCMVYLTQENSQYESVQRMLNILGCKDPTRISKSEILEKLGMSHMINNKNNEPDVEMVILYKENLSCDTNVLYDIYDELYQEGYEVVVFIQDHIKRIKSATYRGPEIRLQLGHVVNEFKAFATAKKCVFITISHLNVTAVTKMNDSLNKGNIDPLKTLDRDCIGESQLMIDNTDLCIFIHKTVDNDGKDVMCFKRIKERVKCPVNNYIVHPLENGVDLISDLYSKPLSRLSINTESLENDLNVNVGRENNLHNTIGKFDKNLGRNIEPKDLIKEGSNTKIFTLSDMFNKDKKDKDSFIEAVTNPTTEKPKKEKIKFFEFKEDIDFSKIL